MRKETIAIFDFDGTITFKDSLLAFIRFSKGNTAFILGFIRFMPLLIAMKLGIYPNWKVKQKVFAYFYKGIPITQFNKWGKDFSQKISTMIRPLAMQAILEHQKNKDKIYIISASVENWLLPWAQQMGISNVLATQIAVDDKGIITGEFSTPNCYGQEKVNRLLAVIEQPSNYHIIAYGDSAGDKALIDFADEGYYNKFKV